MLSVRLPEDLEVELNRLAEVENLTKTDIVISALESYINECDKKFRPYELGKDLFGIVGTGDRDSSTSYKKKVGEKINAKFDN